MEPAVSLTKYVGAEEPLPLFVRFMQGFSEHAVLTEAEYVARTQWVNANAGAITA
ncbi:hypothetical protein M885DRAFT_564391 [Pelagophyceae sp. CCMP2097]|nr:hypothetical protein M885DRAFT_564391 [Pelagophyceae sp. CCMP2097]